jgi:hypothetical protein
MLHEIRNPFLRRAALVFTVVALIICLGPLALINAVLGWVEDEFEVNLSAAWRGPAKETK